MNFLMLRGQVPQDRDPSEIIFDSLEECDDMWTHLFNGLLKREDKGEIWYWRGDPKKGEEYYWQEDREKKYTPNLKEYFTTWFDNFESGIEPDIIFCRGGFRDYHPVLQRYKKAIKIYYGAGKRFLPIFKSFMDYDMILVDSMRQKEITQREFPNAEVQIFFKPAADNLFYKMDDVVKEYNVCYPADGRSSNRKGHSFIYSTVPSYLRVLNLGGPVMDENIEVPANVKSKRVLRKEVSRNMQKCEVGIVASEGKTGFYGMSWDSNPRVIPELLASDIPIVVLNELEFLYKKYITPETGKIASKVNFWETVEEVLVSRDQYSPRKYYENNLTTKHAADYLRSRIDDYIDRRFSA